MDLSPERRRCLEYLQEKIVEPVLWTIQNDSDSEFAWVLLRQRMLDAMRTTDEKFDSVLMYQYDPFPQQTPDGMGMLFTLQDDFEEGPVPLHSLDPFPWDDEEEPGDAAWPPEKVPGLTDARAYGRRATVGLASRRRSRRW